MGIERLFTLAAGAFWPRTSEPIGPDVGQVVEAFLDYKRAAAESGDITHRMFGDYERIGRRVARIIGAGRPVESLAPLDFAELRCALGRGVGPRSLGMYIRMTRTLFAWAATNRLIERPVHYGSMFATPRRALLRRNRRTAGSRAYSAAELRAMLAAAGQPLRTFILLGINAGYGQHDCASLPRARALEAIETGVLDFERPKTGICRSAVLWPETLRAMAESCRGAGDLAFTTRRGNPWVRARLGRDDRGRLVKATPIDAIGQEFNKLLRRLGLPRRGFYALRRTFRTVADEAGDEHAAKLVMGHALPWLDESYIDTVRRRRVRAVCEFVRGWLFGSEAPPPAEPRPAPGPGPASQSGPQPPLSSWDDGTPHRPAP